MCAVPNFFWILPRAVWLVNVIPPHAWHDAVVRTPPSAHALSWASDHAHPRSSDTASPRLSKTTGYMCRRTPLASPVLAQAPPPVANRVQGLATAAASVPVPLRSTTFQRSPAAALLNQFKSQEIHKGDSQVERPLQHSHLSPHVMLQCRESGRVE